MRMRVNGKPPRSGCGGKISAGIGTGSIAVGWISERYGFGRAFGIAGALALLSIPYYLYLEKRQWTTSVSARQD